MRMEHNDTGRPPTLGEPGCRSASALTLGLLRAIGKPKLIKLAQDRRREDRARYGRRKKGRSSRSSTYQPRDEQCLLSGGVEVDQF
jgi:hypothetical protein